MRRRAFPFLLLAATLVPIGALGWLGARILQQERDVESRRRSESLEAAAGRLALAIDSRFGDIEEQLARGLGIRFTAEGLEAPPAAALLYGPAGISAEPAPPAVFANADELEFQRQDLAGAAAADRELAKSASQFIRAEALNRLGRVLRKAGDT